MKFGFFAGTGVSQDAPRSESQGHEAFLNHVLEAQALGVESLDHGEAASTEQGSVKDDFAWCRRLLSSVTAEFSIAGPLIY